MTAFALIMFLHMPNGNVSLHSAPALYLGADLCERMRAVVTEVYAKQGFTPATMTTVCVDSKLVPGLLR